ncbi:MAG: DUF5627 domain-containing protein [Lacibacter sp.]
MKIKLLFALMIVAVLVSCNKKREFPDYDYQTVYFAYQYPVRTITLGEDIYSTELDNQYKCKIMATMGGVYENKKNITIDFVVDNSLCNGLLFTAGGAPVTAMPTDFYSLASNKITIPSGSLAGGVEVQLTDAFFADPKAISNNYVIPLRMTAVSNADSILSGKNFILYAIKFVNPWHGNYLRRGKDEIVGKPGYTALSKTNIRHQQYVEKDEVNKLSTLTLTDLKFPLFFKDVTSTNVDCSLRLKFDNSGNCTVTSGASNVTATGTGKFVKKGEKNSWGNTDRDAIYLNYEIDFAQAHITCVDTLVLRDRAVTMEVFAPVKQ